MIGAYLGTAAALACSTTLRAETPAGTPIVNTAQLRVVGTDAPIISNQNTIIVAERLDVALTLGSPPVVSGATTVVAVLLTNQGNGREAFTVSADTSPASAAAVRIAIDGDGDGRYDAAHDPDLVGGATPMLAPGQAIILFALVADGTPDTVTIRAAAATGSGTPGTAFAGAGDGGGDAVTGRTGAAASVTVPLGVVAAPVPTLTKSAAITAPDGSAQARPGATITYTLVARFPGAAAAPRIVDAIPAGTAYAADSLSLDGAALSDAGDADAGEATPARISVALPDQAAGAAHTISFKVVIQ